MSIAQRIARATATICLALAPVSYVSTVALADELVGDDFVVEGVVVRSQPAEVVVDLGRERGVPVDAVVHFYRRLEVTHPVTGETLVDRFPIGRARLSQVGELLSIATDLESLERRVEVGDYVVYEASPEAERIRAAEMAAAAEGAPAVDPEQAALEEAFRATLGQPFDERIRIWQAFLTEWPDAPSAEIVAGELSWLRQELDAERRRAVPLPPEPPGEPERLVSFVSAPTSVFSDEPVTISAAVVETELVSQVRVLVRRGGEPTFRTEPMTPDGDYNWRLDLGTLDQGTTELFVEAVRTNGAMELLRASASDPLVIDVEPPIRDAEERVGRSRTTTVFEYVNFNRGPPVDQYLRFEADFRYALDVSILSGFLVGGGVFLGDGNSLAGLRAGAPSTPQNVNYGFAGLDLSFLPRFGAQFRFQAGNGNQERDDESFEAVFGAQLILRFGEADGTRLEVGGSLTKAIGNQAWAALLLEPIRRWPMVASVIVTNLPVGEDLGVRLSFGVGYRFADWIEISVINGINARTVDDFGATIGSSLQLNW